MPGPVAVISGAALFFLLPYATNIGARFLIPVLPFVALAMALALGVACAHNGRQGGALLARASHVSLAALAVAGSLLAWLRVIRHYRAAAGTWLIATMPWQPAIGLVASERYLEQRSAGYPVARMIDGSVPADKRVWSGTPEAESCERPDLLVSYQSAEGDHLLTTPEWRFDQHHRRRSCRVASYAHRGIRWRAAIPID